VATQQPGGASCIGQLVRRDPDMVELLAHRQRYPVTVKESAAPRRQHLSLGSLTLGLFRPPVALEQLELGSACQDSEHAERKAGLDDRDAGQRLCHQGLRGSGPTGTGKRMNSESAGS
jgi:hypothetical protein